MSDEWQVKSKVQSLKTEVQSPKTEVQSLRSKGKRQKSQVSTLNSQLSSVADYIRTQREHHVERSFEDEFVSLLKLHEIDYDERYLFG